MLPALDDLGWCDMECVPTTCVPRRYSGCDWIALSPGSAKVFFRMLESEQRPAQFIPNRTPMLMKLYRQGTTCLIAKYPAWQRDANGYVGFYFDDAILRAHAGYYVGDVFLGCEYCFSLKFRLAPCELVVDECYVEPQVETCGKEVCAIYPAIGEGTIGGVDCALLPVASCTETCGVVPPYVEDSNPNDFKFDPCQAGCDPTIPLHPIGGTVVGGI